MSSHHLSGPWGRQDEGFFWSEALASTLQFIQTEEKSQEEVLDLQTGPRDPRILPNLSAFPVSLYEAPPPS